MGNIETVDFVDIKCTIDKGLQNNCYINKSLAEELLYEIPSEVSLLSTSCFVKNTTNMYNLTKLPNINRVKMNKKMIQIYYSLRIDNAITTFGMIQV